MDKLISQQAALDILDEFADKSIEVVGGSYERARKAMCDLASAQPERKTGRWEKAENDGNDGKSKEWVPWLCSECGYRVDRSRTRFCPNCGSLMLKEGEG